MMMEPIGAQPQGMMGHPANTGLAPMGRGAVYAAPPQHHTTVVVNQPTSGGNTMQVQGRDWNSGLCSCFDDILTCCLSYCFPCCFAAYIACRLDEFCCLSCFVPGGMMALRTKLRVQNGIRGSICNDCITLYMCPCCALAQMGREINATQGPRGGRRV